MQIDPGPSGKRLAELQVCPFVKGQGQSCDTLPCSIFPTHLVPRLVPPLAPVERHTVLPCNVFEQRQRFGSLLGTGHSPLCLLGVCIRVGFPCSPRRLQVFSFQNVDGFSQEFQTVLCLQCLVVLVLLRHLLLQGVQFLLLLHLFHTFQVLQRIKFFQLLLHLQRLLLLVKVRGPLQSKGEIPTFPLLQRFGQTRLGGPQHATGHDATATPTLLHPSGPGVQGSRDGKNRPVEMGGDEWRLVEISGDWWRLVEISGD